MEGVMDSSFFNSLFDMSFSKFITPKIIKYIYIISVVIIGLLCLFIAFSGFSKGVGSGFGALILASITFIVWITLTRLWLEFVMAVFQIAENTAALKK